MAGLNLRVVVLQHVPWEGLGLLAGPLRKAGADVRTLRLYGKPPRLDVSRYDAIVALGSPSTAYKPETNPNHDYELEIFRLAREEGIPSFDVCYSMQMFTVAHGGVVERNPNGKEVGFFEVKTTREAAKDPVFKGLRSYRTLEWHGDCVTELPKGAVLLASSGATKNQAAVVDGIHYLVQSDGQAAYPAMLRRWLEHDAEWATAGTGLDSKRLLEEASAMRRYYSETSDRIFSRFLALAGKRAAKRRPKAVRLA